jgi:putative hydrolase of the HAD superfamily
LPNITAVFSDVGGVLGTNGWDRGSRHRLVEKYGLTWEEFEDRHELLANALDTGDLTLDQYLDRTIFYRSRPFTREQAKEFLHGESRPYPESLAVMEKLAASGQYFLAALNNESTELNQMRIERFGLRKYFAAFFSSCYLGVRKPDPAIYRLALEITQRLPSSCVFIDDRALNLDAARALGMNTLQYQNAAQLESDLRGLGVEF